MARKRKPLPLLENITIEAVAAEGKCITRVDDQVIFVPFCVPGDVVDLQVVKKKHKYCEAKVVRFIKKSDVRQEPMCEHFGICGGPYEEQIKAKQKQVEDQLTRIGKIELPEFRPIMGSVKTQEYRNKIEFGCSNKRWFTSEELAQLPQKEDDTVTSLKERHAQNAIGFHITGAFDKIYPIKKCWLMDDLCNEIRNFVFEYADSHNYTFYDLREQHGLLRDMMIRNSNTGEWMLVFQFHYDEEGDEQRALELMQQVADKFPQITSLMYVDNQKGNYTITANFVAHKAKKVIGIEYVPEAIEDAKVNSQVNNIENTLFYAGDMKDILTNDFIAQHGRPDVIITDPPRAGMHPDVVNVILNAAPNRIVYVSCNPATQARDLQLMDDHYKVAAVQPVDMFPHTPHVENVVLLEKRSDAEIKQKKKERREREKAIAEAKAAKEAEKLALEAAKAEDLTAEELAAKK